MRLDLTTAQMAEAIHWKRPDVRVVPDGYRTAFLARCNALQDVTNGVSLRHACRQHGVNRTTLTQVTTKAFERGPDGAAYGYRACLPYGLRRQSAQSTEAPLSGRPHALNQLLTRFPAVGLMLETFKQPLPPGRLPPAFGHLLRKIRGFLKEQGMNHQWPLNAPDKGRRAFARYVRMCRRERLAAADMSERTAARPAITSLSQIVTPGPYDRFEFDAHAKDVKGFLAVPNAKGEIVAVPLAKVWVLVVIDVGSQAVMARKLVYGKSYTALDVAQCFASLLQPWVPRVLSVPGLAYRPGAAMPQALPRGCQTSPILAMDNAMAHKAKLPSESWVKNYDGIINEGPAHVPEIRGTVENFFKYFEDGAIRHLPGGYIPATSFGQPATATSEWRAIDHPIAIEALEDLFDVLITSYNASPLPSRQQRSPLDILRTHQSRPDRWVPPPRQREEFRELTTECRQLRITGGGRSSEPPHVHFAGVEYRHRALDKATEYLGQSMHFLIDLEDLRTIVMVDERLNELLVLRAAAPWHITQHDLTTRRRIRKLSRSGELEILGAHDAIAAYAAYTLKAAQAGRGSADPLARLLQLASGGQLASSPSPPSPRPALSASIDIPHGGRVSFDNVKDR